MLSTSWELLRQKCGFSESEFALFQDMLKSLMRNPENRVGLDGPWPILRRRTWEKWLDMFIDDIIGARWWGQGTAKKWSFPADREKVRSFLSEAVQYVSGIIKQQLGAKKEQLSTLRRSSVISEEGTFEGCSEDFESGSETSTSTTTPEPEQQENNPTESHLGPSRLGIGKPLDLIIKLQEAAQGTRIPKRKPSSVRKEESKTKLRKGPLVIDISSEPDESRASIVRKPPVPGRLQHNHRRHSHSSVMTTSHILAPGAQNPAKQARFSIMAAKRASSQGALATAARPEGSARVEEVRAITAPKNRFYHTNTSPITGTAPGLQKSLDFILETRLSISNEIKLIYGADFASLSQLVDRIRERHRLESEQQILGIKVTIRDKTFDIDLEEPRDWRYISRVIFENGSRAEVLVLAT